MTLYVAAAVPCTGALTTLQFTVIPVLPSKTASCGFIGLEREFWQTESGWPILTIANGVEKKPSKFGSPGIPMYGYNVKLLHEITGEEIGANEKGVVTVVPNSGW